MTSFPLFLLLATSCSLFKDKPHSAATGNVQIVYQSKMSGEYDPCG